MQKSRRREKKQAIFYQRSKALQNEFALINLVTVRESVRGKLDKLIKDVKMQSRVCDQACMAEIFNLITSVREATYDLLDSVAIWQQGFTSNIRPQLLNIDYLVDMTWSMDFFSATHLRREFSFQLGAGNFMLLPLPTVGRTKRPYKVSKELGEALHNFANPTEHRLVKCYHILLNCMPQEDFKKMMAINYWMKHKWVPNIEVEKVIQVVKAAKKMDMLSMLMRGELPVPAESPKLLATTIITETSNSRAAGDDILNDVDSASSAVPATISSPNRSPSRACTVSLFNPDGSVLFDLDRKKAVFESGASPDAFLSEPFVERRASPLRQSRPTRKDSQSPIRKLSVNQDEIFSDDSEDERIAIERKRQKKATALYKRPDVEDDASSPVRGRREKPLADAKTIEEKAAHMSINTHLLRENWNNKPR